MLSYCCSLRWGLHVLVWNSFKQLCCFVLEILLTGCGKIFRFYGRASLPAPQNHSALPFHSEKSLHSRLLFPEWKGLSVIFNGRRKTEPLWCLLHYISPHCVDNIFVFVCIIGIFSDWRVKSFAHFPRVAFGNQG